MGNKDKTNNKILEGQNATAISDKEKKRIIKEKGSHKLNRENWIKMLNKKYD